MKRVKQIVMLQGMGINERGWARMVSTFGRVVLIQQGFVTHVEIWESGTRIFDSPNINLARWRLLDEILFGLISALRTFFLTLKFTRGQKIDLIIAANYHNSLAGLLLNRCGKTRRVVSFLTDYLPPCGTFLVRFHRRLTSFLMEFVAKHTDEVWSLSPRIRTADVNPRHFVVPIYIDDNQAPAGQRDEIAYIGFPSPDHALDVLFEICKKHSFRLNVIGDSPYLQSLKHLAPSNTVFHGILNDEKRIGDILSRCFCGYAVYRDTSPANYSYYGFPSKTLYCFASDVPIIITNVAHFNRNFENC